MTSYKYDSRKDTERHIREVNKNIREFCKWMKIRGMIHDSSKFGEEEKPFFDKWTPKLKNSTYGSPEYMEMLKEMEPAINHHYRHRDNRHHPEHFENGISDMNLFDLIEMFCDWKAAQKRHTSGDFIKSLEINRKRFNMSDQLFSIFKNTIERFK